jgi:glyoxylase-like metal-dependent hydrolase (beta-lactamase superfamily II)
LVRLKAKLGVPLAAHELDAAGLPVAPDIFLKDGDSVKVGELELKVLHLPGHSTGAVGFLIGDYLISGDTLFPGGPGATWAPDEFRQLLETITTRIYALPDETIVLPGHGEGTTIGRSKAEYAVFAAREHGPDLYGDVLWESS